MKRRIGWMILVLGMLGMYPSADSCATPLYGGYNGESALWVEYQMGQVSNSLISSSVIFGSDDADRAWTRVRISLPPLFISLEYTRDYLDIQSVAFRTLFPWPLQFGTEVNGSGGDSPLWWVTAYILLGVGGFDSAGTSWAETGIPGIYGTGADTKGNQWLWFKTGNLLRGVATEPVQGFNDADAALMQESLLSLEDRFDACAGPALLERLNSEEFREAAGACAESLSGAAASTGLPGLSRGGRRGTLPGGDTVPGMRRPDAAACSSALALLLTGGIERELAQLLDAFRGDVQPLLKKQTQPR